MRIEIILLGIIGAVFLIDYLRNHNKITSGLIVKSKKNNSNSILNYVLKRKKSITVMIFVIITLKFLIHYILFPSFENITSNFYTDSTPNYNPFDGLYTGSERNKLPIGRHLKLIFSEKTQFFIPSILITLFFAWLFRDKIKSL